MSRILEAVERVVRVARQRWQEGWVQLEGITVPMHAHPGQYPRVEAEANSETAVQMSLLVLCT